jgi:hypothetical protein
MIEVYQINRKSKTLQPKDVFKKKKIKAVVELIKILYQSAFVTFVYANFNFFISSGSLSI